jgi:murein DD-endopeptidase MepM/ murein hydrolase activator NlpD
MPSSFAQFIATCTLCLLTALTTLTTLAPTVALAASVSGLPRDLRVPGGVAVVKIADATMIATQPIVTYESARVWVARSGASWFAVVGLPLSIAPGEHAITVTQGDTSTTRTFTVNKKRYPVQRLKLNRAMVDPPPEAMARIERESVHLKTVRSNWRASDVTRAAFVLPAEGRLSSRFGVGRVLNGKPRSPHAGLDVAVGIGTPINAPADGVVLDADDYYYCGKTMFIDHGNGLITMHCHLSEFIAKIGDTVKQGQRIALSGATGRVTGPHLHWSVFLNGVSVEPELFLSLRK